jgi:ribosomal protein S12 methylthiotransferase accessory factor
MHTGDQIEVPAQLVYCPFDAHEVYLRNPITTGAAAHTTYRTAVTKGLLEVLEREAYIINYLREIPNRRIPEAEIEDTPGEDIIQKLEDANFDVNLIYLTLDIPVHIVLCILWDDVLEFGTFGMDAGFDFGSTVEDAVIEAYHIYPWQRTIDPVAHESDDITDLDARAEYWRDKGNDKSGINHWLATDSSQFTKRDAVDDLDELLTFLQSSGISIYVSDITTDDVEEQSFKAVRVILPECHPMHLNERFRYTESKRLNNAPEAANITESTDAAELNQIPHPFL